MFHIILEEGFEELGELALIKVNGGACTGFSGGTCTGGGGGGDTPTNSGNCSSLGVPGGTVNSGTCISVNTDNQDTNFDGDQYVVDGIPLTAEEIAFIMANPLAALEIKENSSESLKLYGGHNDIGDAKRHAYWSALNAKDAGLDNAIEYGYAHENYEANPAGEAAMDLHNNKVGWEIYVNNPNASDQELRGLVEQAADSGMLITLK